MKVKAISIRQPWAGLTVNGWKRIETRNWQTKHRGQIAIHVSKTDDVEGANELYKHKGIITGYQLRGAIIAITELINIKRYTSQKHFLDDDNLHMCGFLDATKFGWIWGKITPLDDPIPWRGRPGLFEVEI